MKRLLRLPAQNMKMKFISNSNTGAEKNNINLKTDKMKLNAEKVEIQKTKVKLTISLDINDYNTIEENLIILLNIAIENGESSNILRQVLDKDNNIKIESKHTFF